VERQEIDGHSNAREPVAALDADITLSSYTASLTNLPPLQRSELPHQVEYRGYRELLESYARLEGARSQVIGKSVAGEPLWKVEIGNPQASKVSVVIAGIHPIEWIGIEAAYALAENLSKNPSEDRRVCFYPLANPDGFRKVESNLRAGTRKWVRSNNNGVDLNRNWPTHFRASKGFMAGHNATGPHPCSEPEVAAIVHSLDAIARDNTIDVALSLHSIGKMILMPWGGVWKSLPEREKHQRAAEQIKGALPDYSIRQVSRWVPGVSFAHGMEIDHLHSEYGATAILLECSRGELPRLRPSVLVDPFRIFNPHEGREHGAALANALEAFIRGHV